MLVPGSTRRLSKPILSQPATTPSSHRFKTQCFFFGFYYIVLSPRRSLRSCTFPFYQSMPLIIDELLVVILSLLLRGDLSWLFVFGAKCACLVAHFIKIPTNGWALVPTSVVWTLANVQSFKKLELTTLFGPLAQCSLVAARTSRISNFHFG